MITRVFLNLDEFLSELETEEKHRMMYITTPVQGGFVIFLTTLSKIGDIPVIYKYIEKLPTNSPIPSDDLNKRLEEIFDTIGFKPMVGTYETES